MVSTRIGEMKAKRIPTTQLERDLKHLEANITHWHSFYDAIDLARAKRMIAYMKELKRLSRIYGDGKEHKSALPASSSRTP